MLGMHEHKPPEKDAAELADRLFQHTAMHRSSRSRQHLKSWIVKAGMVCLGCVEALVFLSSKRDELKKRSPRGRSARAVASGKTGSV
jgi:hypothetical protein